MPEDLTESRKEIEDLVEKVCDEYSADLVLYWGPLIPKWDDFLIDKLKTTKKRKNIILMLTTFGGDAHTAYRIVVALQEAYKNSENSDESGEVILFVNSACASAGTLIALGCDCIILNEHAELGPLDVQLRKSEEVGERTSGLAPSQALKYLRSESIAVFKEHFDTLRFGTYQFSTKMAAEIAASIGTGLLSSLYSQLDPIRLAEVERSTLIAKEYGTRILTENVKHETLDRLITGYPSHDFTIVPREAKTLFNKVNKPSELLEELGDKLKPIASNYLYKNEPFVLPWNVNTSTNDNSDNDQKNAEQEGNSGETSTTAQENGSAENDSRTENRVYSGNISGNDERSSSE